MRLYRIAPHIHLNVFNGLGGTYHDGGRWNRPGLPAAYFGCSASVAMLEMANYLGSPRLVPPSYRLGVYEIADDVPRQSLSPKDMPSDWRDFPYPKSTQSMGSDWLIAQSGLLLIVPSSAVPGGFDNIALFNPNHPQANSIRLIESKNEIYPERMFAGL